MSGVKGLTEVDWAIETGWQLATQKVCESQECDGLSVVHQMLGSKPINHATGLLFQPVSVMKPVKTKSALALRLMASMTMQKTKNIRT